MTKLLRLLVPIITLISKLLPHVQVSYWTRSMIFPFGRLWNVRILDFIILLNLLLVANLQMYVNYWLEQFNPKEIAFVVNQSNPF